MEILYWILVIALIVVAFVGLVYPVIPSVLFLLGAYILYGFLFSFSDLSWLFWTIQILFVILLFIADHFANLYSVKKFGGSKAGIWGSTIGLIFGPFIIPAFGILLGPFIGAIAGELLVNRTNWKEAIKIGIGSVVGFISSVAVKAVVQFIMVAYFLFQVWK
ncbi:DUF456 domain-containing protein [Lederbergia graminis]|uniref:DUF456 domain-containing protein n=1 Tax=Lederbergia graminis TaxID=735518 RepID=A0ABW0LBN5_9BACI|nr:DUF456 domain-containing protein [Bacillaceae bacterium]